VFLFGLFSFFFTEFYEIEKKSIILIEKQYDKNGIIKSRLCTNFYLFIKERKKNKATKKNYSNFVSQSHAINVVTNQLMAIQHAGFHNKMSEN
jgi:hypothetical protein